ncbi:immunoglobulin-like domain-containing protein [Psychrobacillus sp. FSL K6-2684]|uniref:immunoglobulin-like domain-containing protein n=1 Tax=Psychrobacillus sp. FSL K6-2684 TaxID=2921547 RepID=UPI0030F581CB
MGRDQATAFTHYKKCNTQAKGDHKFMKKKAIKIAASTAVAASAFVAAAPVQQADAATNVNQLATNAQNAGTVLKWAISYEGSADFKTRPFNEFNAAKKAVAAAEAAANKLSATEKLAVQAKLVDAKVQIVRATAYIDAITSSEKIKSLTSNLTAATASGDLGKVETAYHAASFEYKKQAKLLDRVYGQSTRDGIRNAVKPAMESALNAVKYDVTVKMHLDKASTLIKESKLEEAAAELAKADYNLTLKDAKFTFKSQLEKSYADVAASLPLQAISAIGDGANTVTVKFSKAYTLDKNLTTLEAGQFKINGLTVQSAKLSEDKKSVILTTSTQKANTEYTVTWQGKSVSFKTAAVADTSGIAVNESDVAYIEATNSRTYNVKLTNTDGTPYVGRVTVDLNQVSATTGKVVAKSSAVITTVNGQPQSTPSNSWTGVTDSNGNLVYTVAAANNASASTTSVTHVEPKISKLDGDKKSKEAAVTHFFQLQSTNVIVSETEVTDLYVSASNDYVYLSKTGKKYKWDANDAFFIRGQKVSQEAFEAALSDGDKLTIDYKTAADNVSTWNITVDVTKSANTGFTNPKADVRFDGFNYDLSGKGQAGNTVKVYRGSDLMGTTTVNSDGTWTLKAVNLTQDSTNVFEAFQYAPGKDGYKGTNAESTTPATRTIFEGAFASTGITLTDKDNNGLSVSDELTFSFLNNPGHGHEFKEDLEGTITVHDNLSRVAVYDVEYVNATTLKVVKVVSADRGFVPTSTLTIESTTGVVNQDELAYNVSVSKSNKGTNKIGYGVATPISGAVTYEDTVNKVIYVNNVAYTLGAGSTLKTAQGSVIAVGDAAIFAALNTTATNDEVSNVTVSNGVVTSLVGTKVASQTALAKPTVDAIAAFTKPNATQGEVTAARSLYNALAPSVKDIVTNYALLTAEEAKLATAQQGFVNSDTTSLSIPGDLNNVVAALTLASTGVSGNTDITWTSSDATVVDPATGAVTQPTFTAGDKAVTLTATIASKTVPTVKTTKVFNVVVKKQAATDAEKAAADKDALTIAGDLNNVTDDLVLKTTGAQGSTISWATSDATVVATDGTVVRPTSGSGNAPVTLTASIVNGGTTVTKVFYLTVLAQ